MLKPTVAGSGVKLAVGDSEPALQATVTALPFDS